MLQIEGLLSSQLPTCIWPWCLTRLRHRKRGRIINRQEVCLRAQICSSRPDRSGMMLCNLSLAEVILVHLRKPTHFLILPMDPQSVSESLRTTLQVNLHCATRTEIHTDNMLGSSFLFFCFLNNHITLSIHNGHSRTTVKPCSVRSSPCTLYLLQAHPSVGSATGRWVQKVGRLLWKGHWALPQLSSFSTDL